MTEKIRLDKSIFNSQFYQLELEEKLCFMDEEKELCERDASFSNNNARHPLLSSSSLGRTSPHSSILKRAPLSDLNPREAHTASPLSTSLHARSASLPSQPQTPPRSVSFGQVCIREHSLTIGDHPNCSNGPPVCLDWDFEEHNRVDLDLYEASRGKRRSLSQMMMNSYHRRNMLMCHYGHTEEDINEASWQVKCTQRQRYLTRRKEAFWSAGRTVKRVVDPNAKKTSQEKKDLFQRHKLESRSDTVHRTRTALL